MASATPSIPSIKETSNYAELCRLLVDIGSCVLREIFDRVCPPGNLHTVLTHPQNQAKLQTLLKKRVLCILQWRKLYPADKFLVSSRNFDTSLLLLLLRNIFGLLLPTSSWDKLPPITDTSPEADITRIKVLRDRVCSHATTASVDDSTFSSYWNDIKDTFMRIGGARYQDYIHEMTLDCVDADLVGGYQELLSKWLKDEDCITDKSNEEKIVKKPRKEGNMEDSLDISEQNSWERETVVMPAKNGSAQTGNSSQPELSVKLPKLSDLPAIFTPWETVELPVDFLLLTVEDCEFLSCFAYLKEPFKSYHISTGPVYFGCMGNDQGKKMKIALKRCSKGSDVPGGSLSVSKDAISVLGPKAILSVGACSGLNSEEVKLGDVVVSAKLITAAHKTPPSRDIGNLIKHVADGWKAPLQNADEYAAKVHCDGVVLSISEANRDMIRKHPEAIAIEMEGGGVYAAAHDFKIEWVVVKGIKDFVDETQSPSKKWKQIACVMAASVVAKMLNNPVIFQDWTHFNAGANELPSQDGELKMKVEVDDLKLEEQNKQTGMSATESVRCQKVQQPRPSATSAASGGVSCPQTEDLRTSKEKAFLSIVLKYFNITKPESVEEFDSFKKYAREMRFIITGVSEGSLVITVKCESLTSLEELWTDYSSGRLGEVVQNCFVTEQILKELNLAELRLKTTIDIEEYNACKLYFEKDAHRGASFSEFHPTSSTSESLQKKEQQGKSEQKTKIMETTKLEGTSPLTIVPTTGHGRELEESMGRTGLPEKPTITNTETEVDKDLTVTWSEAEANSTNRSIKYRLECRKKFMKGSTEVFQQGNIVETRHTITGLEYDAEYEVKLFAVNEQGDSEPDVRTFKTKSAVSAYSSALKSSIMYRTEFQPKLFASRTISNLKTDDIFTNLLMQHGRIDLIGDDETCYSRREVLERYGKVSGTPVKHCSEIFLGAIDDQESTNSILVVGKAGIGKSLFCQKVIRDWANNELFQARENTEIPNLKFVYLLTFRQLNLLEKGFVTLREILNCCSALDDKCNIGDSTFEYILKHPKEVMIILNGYDEYSQQDYIAGNLEEQHPNNARRKMPVAALCSKLIKGKILRGAIVMITSRPDESDKMGGIRFKRCVEIAGFSTEQVKEYIEKYFKNDENMKNAVLKHVMNNEDLVSFAHVPMLCYLLCFEMEYTLTKSENPDGLPASTTDIYNQLLYIFELKHCAESKYRREEIPEHFKPPPVIKNTLEKLSELAAKLLVEGKPTFDESEMEGEFELEEVNKLKGSGLLYCGQPFRTALRTTTKHFSFTHLTVQEFFAAHWFVKENRVPDPAKCSEMVFQFMAGLLSMEENEELMEKLIDLPFMPPHLRLRCLKEYRDKEFVKQFMRKNPQAFFQSHGVMVFECFSDVHCVGASFLLDIISELNKEEAGEAQHKYTDTFFTVERLGLVGPHLTLSGIQRVCNSLKNEHCHVSLLRLVNINWSDEYVDFINRLLVRRLTTLSLNDIKITDSGVARLCEALQDPSCKLTTLNLESSGINDTGVASLGEALQHPSCKLTTLNLKDDEITDTGVASLCEALQHPSCKLTTLNLGSSGINDIGVASLGEALQHPSCMLTTLYLEGNDITDIGVASLCEALKHPISKLTTLCISCRGIGDTCVPSLCEALQHLSCKLTTLGMQHCRITGIGVARLCEALQHPSCKLTTLELPALVFGETFAILNATAQRYRPDLKVSYH